jgi:hypothetical protein
MYVNTDLLSAVPFADPWAEGAEGWLSFAPSSSRREIKLTAPAGWKFTEIPPDWSQKSSAGEGSMHYSVNEGILKGEIRLTITGGVLNREAYMELRQLLHAAAVAERRPVTLEPPPRATAKPAAQPAAAPAASESSPSQ